MLVVRKMTGLGGTGIRGLGVKFAVCCVLVASGACSEPGAAGDGGNGQIVADVSGFVDVSTDTGGTSDGADSGPQVDGVATLNDSIDAKETTSEKAQFGEPCYENTDCDSSYCIESFNGFVCSKTCFEDCPEDYACKALVNSGADIAFICVPDVFTLCLPCTADTQCNGGRCTPIGDEGSFCSPLCEVDDDCPESFDCVEGPAVDGATNEKLCRPTSGSCQCTGANPGQLRPCSATNEIGTCQGLQECLGNDGWAGCSAPTPVSEVCDFADNDCNGQVDEGFTVDGQYATLEHCGGCGQSCQIANAADVICDTSKAVPSCIATSCDPGYYLLNPKQCVLPLTSQCDECETDAECGGGTCADLDGGKRCLTVCGDGCDDGFSCTELGGVELCVPTTESCTCKLGSPGQKRSCAATGDLGECFGFQTCDPAVGWGSCDAVPPMDEVCNGLDDDCNGVIDDDLEPSQPCENTIDGIGTCAGTATCFGTAGWVCAAIEPSLEVCDYKDNDCDGGVDEDFQTNNQYDQFDHCGACNTTCAAGFPNAQAVCDAVTKNPPQCVVSSCAPGFIKLNDFQCISASAKLCEPCSVDDSCAFEGAKCIELTDGSFCSKPCAGAEDCPSGYNCEAVAEGGQQCVPTTNSCTCDGTNPDLQRACSKTWESPGQPLVTCEGFQQCTESGWGSCTVGDDVCDGVDNDCDGTVDGPWVDGNGQYVTDQHCGVCGNNCSAIPYAHAHAECTTGGAIPGCEMVCESNFSDVNDNPSDGCECGFASATDKPDGADQNCDGVDGEVDNGIFVSKSGDNGAAGTIDAPLLTISAGIAKAQNNKRDVYVATGVYSEAISLKAGVAVYGGYSGDFKQRNLTLYETAILGPTGTASQPGAVNAQGLSGSVALETVLDGFLVFGADAPSTGQSSYGIWLADCGAQVTIRNNRVFAGDGANGAPGSTGSPGTEGINGAGGTNTHDIGKTSCAASDHRSGGGGGQRSCGGAAVHGGGGGTAVCPNHDEDNAYPSCPSAPLINQSLPAELGSDGSGSQSGSGGAAGLDGYIDAFFGPYNNFACANGTNANCGSCQNPSGSLNGSAGVAGQAGSLGTTGDGCGATGGMVSGHIWSPGLSVGGGAGSHGSGGGGGGAGGGVETWDCETTNAGYHDIGASGGGGGSGGCAGTGGTAGTSGGASLGIFISWGQNPPNKPAILDNILYPGAGGVGGFGGPGGTGGAGGDPGNGGLGGTGALITFCAGQGGSGGAGGTGGHGGGGGGGCGGPSYGVFVSGSGGVGSWKNQNTYAQTGQAGPGGTGGASLGSPGGNGGVGASADTNY
ncbi:MAG: hypothetical protein ACI9OJ_001296 [Myxococcota bacterium]|jgi:hypothetical protein